MEPGENIGSFVFCSESFGSRGFSYAFMRMQIRAYFIQAVLSALHVAGPY